MNLFKISNLRCSYDKNYQEGHSKIVLSIKELTIPKGKIVFIVGESGIGKSTILETLGMMNRTIVPDPSTEFSFFESDESCIDLTNLWNKRDSEISAFRLKHYSFIFQSTNLMRNFTAYENVALTKMLQGYSKEISFEGVRNVLAELGLSHIDETRMTHELSGGQRQRLAFARAILPDFTVLFGDEPTGNLDGDNAARAMELLTNKLASMNNSSAIIVSHDMKLAVNFADVVIKIRKESYLSKEHEEIISYGVIDKDSVFVQDENGLWTNSTDSYESSDFEQFLKHI